MSETCLSPVSNPSPVGRRGKRTAFYHFSRWATPRKPPSLISAVSVLWLFNYSALNLLSPPSLALPLLSFLFQAKWPDQEIVRLVIRRYISCGCFLVTLKCNATLLWAHLNEKPAILNNVKHLSCLQIFKRVESLLLSVPIRFFRNGLIAGKQTKRDREYEAESLFFSSLFFSPGYGGCLIPYTWLWGGNGKATPFHRITFLS